MNKNNIIDSEQQKRLMLDMLRFVDNICRKNGIKYSLIGGSLIGAIRHHGFIPWDDDLDIILTRDNYNKLKKILDAENGRYQTLKYDEGGRCFCFIKLIDKQTQLIEGAAQKLNPNYGVYIDVLQYCYMPNTLNKREKYYRTIKLLESIIGRRKLDFKGMNVRRNVIRLGKNIFSVILGYKTINKMFDKILNYCDKSEYVVSNWPAYGFEKEVQLRKNTEKYIDVEFEDMKAMVFENYDEILRTTFGNYMELPPKQKQIPKHNIRAWWKEDYEE
ncbi:LicD family protein [Candidatus Saccharibacteria bacterium]|nr:LicD family protein [Candidatus Saccharibacteria bacterium]